MDKARRRKSESAAGTEEVREIQKHKALSRRSLDSGAYIDDRIRDNMYPLDLGKSSASRASGIAKLLVEDVYREIDSKRPSQSVASRLMIPKKLSSIWRAHRQQKMLSDSYQQKNVSIDTQPNRLLYDGLSNRRSPMKQQEFKDVHEVGEASGFLHPRCSSKWSASSMLSKSEMALLQQKFLDGKRLFADETTSEKLWESEEQEDILDTSDFEDFDRHDDYLIANHLHDLEVNPSIFVRSHTAVSNPSISAKYECNAKARTSERDSNGEHDIMSYPEREGDLLLEPHNHHSAHTSRKPSKVQLEEKNEEDILPMRIVVLKPKLGNMQSAGMSSSSLYHSRDHALNLRKMKENSSIGGAEKILWNRKNSSHNEGTSKPASTNARKIAREITRRMKEGCDETFDVEAWLREFVGDENSDDAHGSDFGSEMFNLSSRNSFGDDNKWGKYPSSSPVEWSVNREAKKRLSERWKKTQRYQELEIVGKSSTLGEMLDVPDRETRSKNYANTSLGRASTRLGINNANVMCNGPLGIKSGNDLKGKIHETSSRSRSLPPSIGRTSHQRGTHHDILAEENHLMHSDLIHCAGNKVGKGNASHKEIFSSQDSKCRSKKPLSSHHLYINEINSTSEANFEIQMEPNVQDLSELMIQVDQKDDSTGSPLMIAEHGRSTLESSVLHPKQSSVVGDNDKAATHDQKDSYTQELNMGPPEEGSTSSQYLEAEPAYSANEVDDRASPVSVLEFPSIQDTSSSSNCLQKISAALNELRIQLELLKMESGAYTEISSLIPTEEGTSQLCSILPKGNCRLEPQGWEASYALDALIYSGVLEFGLDMFRVKWYSKDCPLNPRLFDNLEKRYNEMNGLRSDRRLLFDRINAALLEIFQLHADFSPWMMTRFPESHLPRKKEQVRDALEKLIDQESANGQVPERILEKDTQWRDSSIEIGLIGAEIENMLIDDMITEFLSDC